LAVMICSAVSTEYEHVTDRQTDRQTDKQTSCHSIVLTMHVCVAR